MDTDSTLSSNYISLNDALSSGHGPVFPLQNRRRTAGQKEFMDAISFVDHIKARLEDNPHVYRSWRNVLEDRRYGIIDSLELIRRTLALFWEYDDILRRFNTCWPEGYSVELTSDPVHTMSSINITTPNGMVTYSASQIHKRYLVPPAWAASVPSLPQSSGATLQRDAFSSSVAEPTMQYENSVDFGTQMHYHADQI